MTCASCGHDNPAAARFCNACGTALAPHCAACGADNPAGARFCNACGAPLAARAPRAADKSEARKIVTILFADLAGSTALQERLDPESARGFMERYYAAARAAVAAHGGTVVKLLGDGVMAAFGVPRVAEDDAVRAVRAAVEMVEAVTRLAVTLLGEDSEASRTANRLSVRVAVNTGEVVVSSDDSDIVGDPVNVAARLQQEAGNGEVVIGESTQRLVASLVTLAPLGSFALKGRTEAVKAYRVVSLQRPASATAAAFVGRDAELARLTAVYEAAVAAPAARLAVLLGSPGLGKSRLIDELGRRLGAAATVIAAQCDAAGGGTFAPIAAALRQHLGVDAAAGADTLHAAIEAALPPDDADRGRVAGGVTALLAGSPASPEETFFVVRRLLAGIAAARPVLLVIDDLHWAEPLLLDLVEHLVQWGGGVPLLVLVGARPELRDTRATLATPGPLVAEVVALSGLDAGAATRLAANVIGAADLPAAVAGRLLATSEGNPLFVAELVRMLVQEGALAREGERWIVGANLAALEMPPTIHALLAARLERLRPEERTVLERAAVVGRHFSRNAVAALLSAEADDLDARLESLKRSELIEADSGWFLGEPVLRFHHVLIRDAAYRRLLKGTRAELHARLADWVEARAGAAAEHDETIGRHLEQAHQHLRELGPLDAHGRSLGERAAQRLAAAGRRALAGDDLPLAAGLLGRAIERLDADADGRADLALDWCEALLAAGDVGPAARAIAELARFLPDRARPAPDDQATTNLSARLAAWHTCFTGQLTVLTAPQDLQATADAVAAAAAHFATLGDAAGEAKAHQVHAQALARLGKVGACEAALDRALAAARRAGDRRRANAVLAGAPLAALWGPSPVTRASGRCLDVVRVLRITQGAPAVEAVALSCQGVLEALRGRTDAARRMIASSRRMVEELGITHRLLEADAFAGRVELLEGDAVAAERSLRGAYEGLRDLGLRIDAAQAAALLARALLAQGRADEAEALSRESEALAGDDLQAAIAWRGVRAEALAQRGEHAAAVDLAQAAVTIAAATDALLDHADARLALAAALRAAGRRGEADAETRRATELWEAKGATLLAERVRCDDRPVESTGRPAEPPVEPGRSRPRRVRANTATASAAEFDAAFASRDIAAIEASFINAAGVRVVDHPTESTYGRQGAIDSFRRLLRFNDPVVRHEPLATLGESLGLFRRRISTGGTTGGRFDVAEFEREEWVVTDPGVLIEIFAADRLGAAVTRLYEHYAERLPAGPGRDRAAATARSVAAVTGMLDHARMASAVAPAIEVVDHRILGTWSARGAAALLQHVDARLSLGDAHSGRVDDILELRPEALLLRRTLTGTDRDGGGAFDGELIILWVFGDDGRATRWELFDAASDVEALARLDALTAAQARGPVRRLAANAVTAVLARMEAAFSARDLGAIDALCGDAMETLDHPNAATYARASQLDSSKRMMRLPNLAFRLEVLATLGEPLGLFRRVVTASGTGGGDFDVADYEMEHPGICALDADGRIGFFEIFGANHLGDAVASLYQRYADRLPDGAARRRATATAAAVAAMVAPPDLDRYAAALAPSVEFKDHRTVGFASGRGAANLLRGFRSLLELADDVTTRVDDVICLEPGAVLLRWSVSGTDRRGGGPFESVFLLLWVFGPDGLIVRDETFDAERHAEALARFEALTAEPVPPPVCRRVTENAASNLAARFEEAFAAADDAILGALFASELEVVDHPNGATYGRDGHLASLRGLRRAHDPGLHFEPIATLGESLCLAHRRIHASGMGSDRFDVGPYEREELVLFEVVAGCCRHIEVFAADRLGDAVAAVYRRQAAVLGSGPGCARAAATARALAAVLARAPTLESWSAAFAADAELVDRRPLGFGSLRGRTLAREFNRALFDLEQFSVRADHVLGIAPDALLFISTTLGTSRASGGDFERQMLQLWEFDGDGLIARISRFEPDDGAEALARFEELTGTAGAPAREASVADFANTASRSMQQMGRCWAAHDWEGVLALISPMLWMDDRRRMIRLEIGFEAFIVQFRMLFEQPGSRWHEPLLATRGDRLALHRTTFEAEVEGGGGPLAIDDHLSLVESGADGRCIGIVAFDLEDLDAAYAELDARWAAGEAAAHPLAAKWLADCGRFFAARDWDGMAAIMAPDLVSHSHRLVSWGTLHGPAGLVSTIQMQMELAPDTQARVDHVRTCEGGLLLEYAWRGTREGGAFENVLVAAIAIDARGQAVRVDVWEAEQLAQAQARFEQLARRAAPRRDGPARVAPNAASRVRDRLDEAFMARNWSAMRALASDALVFEDRRRWSMTSGGVEMWLKSSEEVHAASGITFRDEVIAAPGERVELRRRVVTGIGPDGGEFEIEFLVLTEIDAAGTIVASINFDVEALAGASLEAEQRFLAGDGRRGGANAATRSLVRGTAALGVRGWERFVRGNAATAVIERWHVFDAGMAADWDALRATCAPGLIFEDRQGFARVSGDRDLMIASLRERTASGATVEPRLIGTAGERVAVMRMLWSGGPSDGRFEIEYLSVTEVDAAGLLIACILFGADDWRGAQREAWARWAAIDPSVAATVALVAEANDAFNAQDRARLRALFAEDTIVDDHRRTGIGRVEGGDAYVDSLAVLWDLASATRVDLGSFWLAYDRHGALYTIRRSGDVDGGGPFESDYLMLIQHAQGRLTRVELFEIEQLDAALERFESLRPDPKNV